jgi:hypothetical protein
MPGIASGWYACKLAILFSQMAKKKCLFFGGVFLVLKLERKFYELPDSILSYRM